MPQGALRVNKGDMHAVEQQKAEAVVENQIFDPVTLEVFDVLEDVNVFGESQGVEAVQAG